MANRKKSYGMRLIKTILIFLLPAITRLHAQQTEGVIKTGNDLYKKGDYSKAGEEYKKASTDIRAKFNYGNTLYRQDKKNEASGIFEELSVKEDKPDLRSRSFYNKGVILSGQRKLEESIEAYKSTLRLNPDDREARENLQKALLELKKKTPPKKEEKKKTPPQKKPSQPKINPKQAEQKMKQLQQKEKETQQRVQKKPQAVSAQVKDW